LQGIRDEKTTKGENKMKKTLSIILVVALVFALASCTKKADEKLDKEDIITDVTITEDTEKTDSEETQEKDDENAMQTKPDTDKGAENTSKPEDKKEPTKDEQVVKPAVSPESSDEKPEQESKTVAGILKAQFAKIGASGSALSVAEQLVANPVIQFSGAALAVEEGYLNGFDNVEIKGFSEGAMFAPMIGTIPFVGYVFTLDGSVSADAFVSQLTDNANLRWNICTQADEMMSAVVGNKVFFVMSPKTFEE